MILQNGTKVILTGGHYEDQCPGIGTILASRKSKRDGQSYIVEFGGHVGKVQIKEKFISEASENYSLEGKWMIAPRGIKVFEESDAKENHLVLSRCDNKKNVLVTLVYEDYGTTVANVVFQGQYAVVPVKSLIIAKSSGFA